MGGESTRNAHLPAIDGDDVVAVVLGLLRGPCGLHLVHTRLHVPHNLALEGRAVHVLVLVFDVDLVVSADGSDEGDVHSLVFFSSPTSHPAVQDPRTQFEAESRHACQS